MSGQYLLTTHIIICRFKGIFQVVFSAVFLEPMMVGMFGSAEGIGLVDTSQLLSERSRALVDAEIVRLLGKAYSAHVPSFIPPSPSPTTGLFQ